MDVNELYSLDQIANWIKSFEPNLKQDPLLIAQRYQRAVIDELVKNYLYRDVSDKKLNLYLLSTKRLQVACGRYGPRGKERYWWPVLHKQFPLITVVTKGSHNKVLNKLGTLTRVKVNFEMNWEAEYIETIRKTALADESAYDWAPVDLESIGAFILKAYNKEHRESAMNIMAIAEQFKSDDKFGLLPMLKRPAESKRMYYGGINLQNCPAVVRHAALGQHHSYDLRSSVYAWQMYMLRAIHQIGKYDKPAGTICTRELINDKNTVRNRLVETLKEMSGSDKFKIDIIKQALTAIGFGARSSNAYYNESGELVTQGIAGIIRNEIARKAFLKHPWVVEFLAEQDAIGKQICDATLAICPEYRTDPVVANNGKLSRKRLLAFLYQQSESRMMRHIISLCEKHAVLLWVHDGFCTRSPINLADINAILSMDYGDGIQLIHTAHGEWHEHKLEPVDENSERAQRHKAELDMWASKGYDVSNIHHANVVQFRPQRQQAGHYNDGVSDYDAGRDPYANSSRGLLNEQQMIRKIYGN